jgi:hypothetical protein
MPWAVAVSLDADKTTNGAEVGTVTGTYTDASVFAAVPFVFAHRTEFRAANKPAVVAAFNAALAAETAKRNRETIVGAALATALNG